MVGHIGSALAGRGIRPVPNMWVCHTAANSRTRRVFRESQNG